jgi:hypothetical protein
LLRHDAALLLLTGGPCFGNWLLVDHESLP